LKIEVGNIDVGDMVYTINKTNKKKQEKWEFTRDLRLSEICTPRYIEKPVQEININVTKEGATIWYKVQNMVFLQSDVFTSKLDAEQEIRFRNKKLEKAV
jgi:hypothetical protein